MSIGVASAGAEANEMFTGAAGAGPGTGAGVDGNSIEAAGVESGTNGASGGIDDADIPSWEVSGVDKETTGVTSVVAGRSSGTAAGSSEAAVIRIGALVMVAADN